MSALATIQAPDTTAIQTEAAAIVARANALVIADDASHNRAAEELRVIKTLRKRIEDTFKPMKQAADAAKRALLDGEKQHDGPLAQAEAVIKSKAIAYQTEQDRKRREAEEAARQAALAEERKRREAEEAARLAEAEALQAAGDTAGAQQALSEAVAVAEAPIAAPVVVMERPSAPKGTATRTVWKFRIVDPHKIPRTYMVPDEQKIGQYARMMGAEARIEGVEFYSEQVMSVRGL